MERAASEPARHVSWFALDCLAQAEPEYWLLRPGLVLGARSLPSSPLWGPMERETNVYAQLCTQNACRFVALTETEFNRGPNPFC